MIKNSVIQVLFDRKMDPGSIYYTAPEIKSLKESWVKDEDFLPPVDGTDKNHYGYQKGGKTFFKNISIKNKKTDANLNGCFAAPVFDNESTLSISVKDKDSIDENGNGKYTLGWNVPSEKDYNGAVVSYGIKGSALLGFQASLFPER